MRRRLAVALSTAVLAALGLSGCSTTESKTSPASSTLPASSSPVAVTPTAALPPPEALTDVLNRLADPNVPGVNKLNLVEGTTPESAATLDKFANALRDNGYLPMTFAANDIAWSDKNPSDVAATVSVNTAGSSNGGGTVPVGFAPPQRGRALVPRTTGNVC